MNHAALTKIAHSRPTLGASCVVAALCMAIFFLYRGFPWPVENFGLVDNWSGTWCDDPYISLGAEVGLIALIMLLMAYLNKAYNLLRQMSMLHCSLFIIMEATTPPLILTLNSGAVLCLTVLLCTAILFFAHLHENPDTRRIFLVFFLLSAGASVQYAFLVYVPVFILACIQLKLFSLRALSAIFLGIISPWIILMGFGIVTPDDLQMPAFALEMPQWAHPRTMLFLITVALTVVLSILALLQNLIKIISYNAQSRGMQNVITTITVVTALAIVADFRNIYAYLTILNCITAFQLTHMFVAIHNFAKSHIAILILELAFIALFVMKLIV